MGTAEPIVISDYLFRQTVGCPLRLLWALQESRQRSPGISVRHRNKLALRDAIAQTIGEPVILPESFDDAECQTSEQLNHNRALLCGAAISRGRFSTRTPILEIQDEVLTIYQIQGKLLAGGKRGQMERGDVCAFSTRDLLKAAYRRHLLSQKVPSLRIEVVMVYPQRGASASKDHLFVDTIASDSVSEEAAASLRSLFAFVPATDAVHAFSQSLSGKYVHPSFHGATLEQLMQKLADDTEKAFKGVAELHRGCKTCSYRLPEPARNAEKGCWESLFLPDGLRRPNAHIYELPGHLPVAEVTCENAAQEQLKPADGQTAEEIVALPVQVITTPMRRDLQVMGARGERVPRLWIKEGMPNALEVPYPLHCIDFEAATHPVPMRLHQQPYEPVLFQWSCHTMHADGTITHTEWLDESSGDNPHDDFLEHFFSIPNIMKGTVVHYGPFELQTLRKLEAGSRKNERWRSYFERFFHSGKGRYSRPFLDLNRVADRYYFNHHLTNSLSLKEVTRAAVQVDIEENAPPVSMCVPLAGAHQTAEQFNEPFKESDTPYIFAIEEGEAAMQLYLAMKSWLKDPEEREEAARVLFAYCGTDTAVLCYLIRHFRWWYGNSEDGNEFILF
ncbi:MAG: DUF2779 domain-containing protein [Balneolaceae bacterium]